MSMEFGSDLAFELYKEREIEEYNKKKEEAIQNPIVKNELDGLQKQLEHRNKCIQTLKTFYDNLCDDVLQKQQQIDKDYAHWSEVDGQYKQHIDELNEYIKKLKLLNMTINSQAGQAANTSNAAMSEQVSNSLKQLNEDNQIIVNALNSTKQDWRRKHNEMKERLIETLNLVNEIQESYAFLLNDNEKLRKELQAEREKPQQRNDAEDENETETGKDSQIASLRRQITNMEEQAEDRVNELETYYQEEYGKLLEEFTTYKQEVKQDASNGDHAATLQRQIEEMREMNQALQSEYTQLHEAMDTLQRENQRLRTEYEHELTQQGQANETAHQQELEKLKQINLDITAQKDASQKELDALRSQQASMDEQNKTYLRQIEQWKKEAEDAKLAAMKPPPACTKCEQYEEDIRSLQRANAAQQTQINEHIQNAQRKDEQIGDLQASVQDKRALISDLERERESTIRSKLEALKNTATEQEHLRSIIKLLQNQIKTLYAQNRTKIEKHAVGVLGPLSYHLVDVSADQLPINQQ